MVSYDPEYEQWEFGKLSAMREIAFCLENDYPYYYMGRFSMPPHLYPANDGCRVLHPQLREDALQRRFPTPVYPR